MELVARGYSFVLRPNWINTGLLKDLMTLKFINVYSCLLIVITT